MCKPVKFIFSNIQSIVIIGGIIFSCVSWVYVMNGLPNRLSNNEQKVSQLEKDVSELKTSMAKQDTKTDLIVNAVYEIRAVLLKK